jgi:PAS domain S-box-containing protein
MITFKAMITRWFHNLSMASRLSLTFLGMVLGALVLVGVPAVLVGSQALWQAYNTHLDTSTLEKQTNLQNWFDNAEQNLGFIARDPEMLDLLSGFIGPAAAPVSVSQHSKIANHLTNWAGPNNDFLEVAIMDGSSHLILFSSNPNTEGQAIPPQGLPATLTGVGLGPFFFEGAPPQAQMLVSSPISAFGGATPLYLVGRLNLARVTQIVSLRAANQQSDEALLITRQRQLVVVPRLGAGQLAVGQTLSTQAINACVQGQSGWVLAPDYRGVSASIDYRWLPALQACLVVKLDQAEINAPGLALTQTMLGVTLLAMALAVLAATFFSRQLARPLNELVYGVEAFGRGELSLRLPVRSSDEIGRLRAAFNEMATNLQQSLDQLYESQVRYRRLAEGTFEGLMFSENEIVLDSNPQLAWIFGYPPDELIGKAVDELIAPESRELVSAHIRSDYESPYEFRGLHKDGSLLTLEAHGHLTTYEGRLVRMTAIRDLSAQKHAEAAQARLLSIIEATPDYISTSSPDGNYLYLNRAGRRMLGLKEDADISLLTFRSVHPEWANRLLMQEGIPAAIQDGVWQGEAAILTGDGREIPVSKVLIAHCGPNGELEYISTINRDISTRKRMENELRAARDGLELRVQERTRELNLQAGELARSNAELEQFAYVASHDLQEPLRMITSYLQLIQRRYQGKLDADADDYIHYAVDGAHRLKLLINDLLAFSRVGTRGQNFEPADLSLLAGDVCQALQLAIQDAGAQLTFADLPVVTGDPIQLTQLLQNLVTNALKFHGEQPLKIHIWGEARAGEWVIGVRDNGIGIEPQYAQRIFIIFQRLHTREQYPGTGIGLAVCKRIVERHGGKIWVESQLGEGATFYFTLPRA